MVFVEREEVVERYNKYLTKLAPQKNKLEAIKDRELIQKFMKFCDDMKFGTLGMDDYLNTLFSYYTRRIRSEKDRMSWRMFKHNYVLGKNAQKKFAEKLRDKDFRKTINHQASKLAGLEKVSEFKMTKDSFLIVYENEEFQKKKYLNTEVGLDWCLDHTTLHHSGSQNCLNCDKQNQCRELQRAVYPGIHAARNHQASK